VTKRGRVFQEPEGSRVRAVLWALPQGLRRTAEEDDGSSWPLLRATCAELRAHRLFFVPHQTAKVVLAPPGSCFTAPHRRGPVFLSLPTLTLTANRTTPAQLLFWASLAAGPYFILSDNWRRIRLHPSRPHVVENLFSNFKVCDCCLEKPS